MFKNSSAWLFVPDGSDPKPALERTTHLAIGAHPDDNEIMAMHGIMTCFQQTKHWFCGAIITDGRSAPRSGPYANLTDDDMGVLRSQELRDAARIGEYAAQVMLGYSSEMLTNPANDALITDLLALLNATQPEIVYTHNLADRHPSHVATAIRVITALRLFPLSKQPQKVYGCEVWGDLDWLPDHLKVRLDQSGQIGLQKKLLQAFKSQNGSGKRYDIAAQGRWTSHATFDASHAIEQEKHLSYAMDLTQLMAEPELDIAEFIDRHLDAFAGEIHQMIDSVI